MEGLRRGDSAVCAAGIRRWGFFIKSSSRDTFYRFQHLYETGGEEALQELSRRKPIEKNRVPLHVEQAVIDLAIANPALGQKRVSQALQEQGILISSSGVRSVWLRNDLESFKKRLKALEAKSAQDGILLTEEQLRCLEKAKDEKEAHGEIETEHPGYPREPRYLLCRHDERRWAYLSTNVCRYLQSCGIGEAVYGENSNYRS